MDRDVRARSIHSWRLVAQAALALLLVTATAVAQPPTTDVAMAEALYRQARELMDQQKYEEACRKFEESLRLDAATGTLLNLAACHEAAGLLATAWREYGEALLAARRDLREDRVRYAEERIRALEPKLSKLAVVVPAEAAVEGLEIRVDGALIRSAGWGVSAPVDPGKRLIQVTAPGKKSWSTEITIGTDADTQTVQIPALEDAPIPVVTPVSEPAVPPPIAPHSAAAADTLVSERPIPGAVYVSGGITLGFAAVAAVSGAIYLSRRADYRAANEDPSVSPQAREERRDDAQLPGLVSTIFTGAAVAGAVVTGYLFATRPSRPAARGVSVAPWARASGAGLVIHGSL